MSKKHLTVLALSDFHCGHEIGLTPPEFEVSNRSEKRRFRRAMWEWFEKTVVGMKPDILIVNGDAVDGKSKPSEGAELIYADWADQVDMATLIIEKIDAGAIYMTYGTAFHVSGSGFEFEDILAEQVGAKSIGGEEYLDVKGTIFNYKHHLGRSGIPHGRATALLKDLMASNVWHARGEYPEVAVAIRSHVHYFSFAGGVDQLAISLPALQGYGSRYARRLTGTVDIGIVTFDVFGRNDYSWDVHIWRAPLQPPREAE